MTVNDPNSDVRKYQQTRQQVKGADIPESDRETLLEFGEAWFTKNKPSTAKSNLFSTLKVAKLAASNDLPPLTEWVLSDYNHFVARLQRDQLDGVPDDGFSDNYQRSLKQHTKNFLGHLGRDWHEDITVGAAPKSTITREDLITQDELAALFGAAEHPRDQCLLALPLATFQRNAALRALRIKDIHITESSQTGHIAINSDAEGQKRASGKRPLTWATAYVENWLKVHPRKDDNEAPLLCVIGNSGNADRGAPLSRDATYNKRLRTLAERADLPEERYRSNTGRREATIGAHLLRHTGITRAGLSEKFSDQVIKRWAGWSEDSDRLKTYMHLDDDDVLAAAASAYGGDDAEDELAHRPEPGNCDRCGHATEAWMRACPNCTMLLTPEAGVLSESLDDVHEEATEVGIESTDPETIELVKMVRESTDAEALQEAIITALDGD